MSGILRLESLTKGNTLKQGDKTPLKYRLFDADGEKLNIAGKSAVVRLMYPDFLRAGYESEPLTVSSDNTVTFSIDKVIQPVLYYLEITVDGKYIFPSRNDESKLNIDKSSQGSDAAVIEIIGKDVLVRDIKNMVDSEIEPVVNDMIISNQKVIENEKIVQDVNSLAQQLENRQNQVEQFNNQVITEMTDKDVISAPEILGARGGFDTLGERLNEISDQLPLNPKNFGVVGDGVTDDGPALKSFHTFANEEKMPVKYPQGEYYIHEAIDIPIMTDVDAREAHFIINPDFEPTKSTFIVKSDYEAYDWSGDLTSVDVKRNTKKIPALAGNGDCIVTIYDWNTIMYKRYGADANDGISQQDRIIIDNSGNVKNDIVWDFNNISRITIQKIDETPICVQFGKWTTMNNVVQEGYISRSIKVYRSRVSISIADEELLPKTHEGGNWSAIISTGAVAYVDVFDTTLENKPYSNMGVYALLCTNTLNLTLRNVKSKDLPNGLPQWGVMGGNGMKDLKVIDCDMSRLDSHIGTHNISIENTRTGSRGIQLTGSGLLKIRDLESNSNSVISLRTDYGSTWNGDIDIDGVKHYPPNDNGTSAVLYAGVTSNHDFGYNCHIGRSIKIRNYEVHRGTSNENTVILSIVRDDNNGDIPNYYFPERIDVENVWVKSGDAKIILFNNTQNYLDFNATQTGNFERIAGENKIRTNLEINIKKGDWVSDSNLIGLSNTETILYSSGHDMYRPNTIYPLINIHDVEDLILTFYAQAVKVNVFDSTIKAMYSFDGGGSRGIYKINRTDIKTNASIPMHIRVHPKSTTFTECVIYPPKTNDDVITDSVAIKQAHDFLFGASAGSLFQSRSTIFNCKFSTDYPIYSAMPNWDDFGLDLGSLYAGVNYYVKRGDTSSRPTGSLDVGQIYFNTSLNKLEVWSGSEWV